MQGLMYAVLVVLGLIFGMLLQTLSAHNKHMNSIATSIEEMSARQEMVLGAMAKPKPVPESKNDG